jgi:Zn-dependent peptidase ImmA (M78 family)
MAIIRRKNFGISDLQAVIDIALIDTPEKLLKFAQSQEITTLPLDVETIAQKFDIKITYVPLKDELSGILSKDEQDDKWVIQVNKNHHPNRQRYTIAHELGHFCLHRHLERNFEDTIFFRGGESSKTEWQANDFASSILMPEDEFREKVRSGVTNVEKLSEIFKVSTLALRIRAKSLGMSGHGL